MRSLKYPGKIWRRAPGSGISQGHHDRVVVGVDDPALPRFPLGYVMGVRFCGHPDADVEYLADGAPAHEVPHHPAEEVPVGQGGRSHLRPDLLHVPGHRPVSWEIVFAAQPVVIDPGRVWHVHGRQLPLVRAVPRGVARGHEVASAEGRGGGTLTPGTAAGAGSAAADCCDLDRGGRTIGYMAGPPPGRKKAPLGR